MASSRAIQVVISQIIEREKGFVIDHAGPTNFGITIPPYQEYTNREITEEDIRNMTRHDAEGFYLWLLGRHGLTNISNHQVLDLLFDCMVNHGNKPAIKWAQGAVRVNRDGILGPITLAAVNGAPKEVYYTLVRERIKLYAHLSATNPDKYLKYLRGWINRGISFIKEI